MNDTDCTPDDDPAHDFLAVVMHYLEQTRRQTRRELRQQKYTWVPAGLESEHIIRSTPSLLLAETAALTEDEIPSADGLEGAFIVVEHR